MEHNESYQVTRREFLAAAAATTVTPLAVTPAAATQPAKKLNFIFYMPETLRAESVGCYGHPLVQTPHFDGLARQGVHLSSATCRTRFVARRE